MVVRTLFLSAVVATLGNADSFSSYCTIIQSGVVTASNSFSTLLPEGPGAACPDVNFGNAFGDTVFDYTHFILQAFAYDPEPSDPPGGIVYGAVSVSAHVSIGAYAQNPPEFDADPSVTVRFGQGFEISKTQTMTIQQPTATSARFAVLPELRFRTDWTDNNNEAGGIEIVRGSPIVYPGGVEIIAPRIIEYGVPFDVTVIARRGNNWETMHDDYPGMRNIYSYSDLTTDLVELRPVPEPSSFLLTFAALSTAAYIRRKSPR